LNKLVRHGWGFGEENVPAKFRERSTGREVAGLVAVDADGNILEASDLVVVPGPGWPKRDQSPKVPARVSPRLKSAKRSRRMADADSQISFPRRRG